MRFSWFGSLVLVALSLFAVGCQNQVAKENEALWQQNRELQARLADAETKLRSAPDPAELQSMRDEIAKRDAEIAQLKENLQKQPAAGPKTAGIEKIDAHYDAADKTVTIAIPGNVLFDPGRAILKSSADGTLGKIVAELKSKYPGKRIYIDGHTDSDPITRTKSAYKDNFDLAYARAHAVAEFLITHGVSEKDVVIRSYGPNNPKGSKEASRRVELVVKVK